MERNFEQLKNEALKLIDEGMDWEEAFNKFMSDAYKANFTIYYDDQAEIVKKFHAHYNKIYGMKIEEHLIKNVKKWFNKPYNGWKEKAILKAFISGMDECVSQDSFELNQIIYKEIYIDEAENTINVYMAVRDYTITYCLGSMNCTADIFGVIDLNKGVLKDLSIAESDIFNEEDEEEDFDEDEDVA